MDARAKNSPTAEPLERVVLITRIIDAPRSLVFKAWTDPEHMAKWWGPKDFTNPVCELDVRPGGAIRIVMRAPDGAEHPMTGTFHEIVENERLVFAAVAVDPEGKPLLEAFTTVTFAEHGGMTKLTVHASAVGLAAIAGRMLGGMEAGWTQSLERLAKLASDLNWRIP